MSEKLVLVVGAGFSASAGVPLQSAILKDMLSFSLPQQDRNRSQFLKAQTEVIKFINAVFLQRGEDRGQLLEDDELAVDSLTLEDVYTVVDNAVMNMEWLPYYDWKRTAAVRTYLDACLFTYVNHRQTAAPLEPYRALADRLLQSHDENWSTISLNWDTVWDRAVRQALDSRKVVPDYGAGVEWFREGSYAEIEESLPRSNVKLLKLHGSFNWLTCPRCHSIFVSEDAVAEFGCYNPFECPRCFPDMGATHRPLLEPLFLTPTFIRLEFERDTLKATKRPRPDALGRGFSRPHAVLRCENGSRCSVNTVDMWITCAAV